jgi:adenine-specific DNA-methyltransferase
MYLEQYEDTLNNIVFRDLDKTVQKSLDGFRDYFIRYMLEYETRESPTRLTIDNFQTPFDYKIKTLNGNEEREENVDLVETFNYLLGLNVEKIRAFKDGSRYYRTVFGKKDEKNIVVIWRNSKDLDLKKDKKFIEETILKDEKPNRLFINGDSFVKNAEPIEPEFKKLMGA